MHLRLSGMTLRNNRYNHYHNNGRGNQPLPLFLYHRPPKFSETFFENFSRSFSVQIPKNKTENSSDKYPENNIQQQWTNPHSTHPSNHSGRTSTCSRRRQDSHTAEVISPDSCTGTPCGESETLSTDSYSPMTSTGRNTPPQWNSTEVRRERP